MQPANLISFSLQNLATQLAKASDRVLQQQLGIGLSQFKILSIVQDNQRLLQRHIASALNQTEASISRQVKLLHRRQLLITQLNPKDRREHLTTLTSHGLQIIAEALEILEGFQKQFISGLTDHQQTELLNTLAEIELRIKT